MGTDVFPDGDINEGPVPARWKAGDRVQDRPGTSDRFEGPGTVASVSEPQPGRHWVAVHHDNTTVTSWWAEELEPADDPKLGQSRVTCPYRACNGAHVVGDGPTTDAWMDQHAATVAHDTRWPVCYRISYPGNGYPGVAYRPSRAAEDLDTVPEPVYLELDGVVMKTTSDDADLPDRLDDGWRQITETEAMTWKPVDAEPAPLPAEAREAIADALSSAADAFARAADGHELRAGWRVVYVGPDTELHGKQGTIAQERAFPHHEAWNIVGVRFDGHGAIWSIHPSHLALLDLALHEPGCDCPPHMAATGAAVSADRTARGVSSQAGFQTFATTPSVVQLDRDDAARRLADAADGVIAALAGDMGRKITADLAAALADFRAAVPR